MTRKDFEAIAAEIRESRVSDPENSFEKGRLTENLILAQGLADVFQAAYPKFDRTKFLSACDYSQ